MNLPPPAETSRPRPARKSALDDDRAVQRVGDEAAFMRFMVEPIERGGVSIDGPDMQAKIRHRDDGCRLTVADQNV